MPPSDPVRIVDENGVLISTANPLDTTGAGGGGGGGGAVTMAAGAVASGAYVAGSLVDGAIATIGDTNDPKQLDGDVNATMMSYIRGQLYLIGQILSQLLVGVTNISGSVSLNAGNNNVGDVDIASQPARVATTDSITAKLATDTIQNGLTALTPKYFPVAVTTSGDNDLIAAVALKKIRILAMDLIFSAATNVYFKTGGGGVIHGGSTNTMNFAANSGLVLPFCPVGWFETVSGEKLVINLSAGNKCSGGIVYVEV